MSKSLIVTVATLLTASASWAEKLPAADYSRPGWYLGVGGGIGIDTYITENWLVNLELAPSIRFTDYINPSQTTDNVTLTLGLGAQYRW